MSATLTVKCTSSLLNTQILIQNNGDELEKELKDVEEIEAVAEKVTFSCEPCKKVYLTKGGYDRHMRRVHQTAHIKLTDNDLVGLFQESIAELSVDPCYDSEQQKHWKNMKCSQPSKKFTKK